MRDLSFWQPTKAGNWRIAGAAEADFRKDHHMTTTKGEGVLVNLPDDKNRSNLVSVAEYGDVEVAFDFMMAQHSNSGFYLQGRYEVQLLDSWGRLQPAFNDCGGIFARRRFQPVEELFEGHAPLQNAALAPGLWQKMEITFRAPRFNAAGKKTENARITVRLNGLIVQDNRELTGPTGGPISETEAPRGPFMIQGDHGAVAFRNFEIKELGSTPPVAGPVHYEVIYGNFRNKSEFADKKPEVTGTGEGLSWEYARKENGFALRSTFDLDVKKAGAHEFTLQVGGNSIVTINGKEVLPQKWTYSTNPRTVSVDLPVGKATVDILNFKMDDWMPPMLALWVEGPDGSKGEYHRLTSTLALTPADPIFLDAPTPVCFRSFMDYYEGGAFKKRIVHPVNVGNPDRLHYTYDLDNGAVAQIWKGDFLNTSPMWDNRGDGSSRPRGAVLALGDMPTIVPMAQLADTSGAYATAAAYKPMGYDLEDGNLPVFRYKIYGGMILDQVRIAENKFFTRTIETEGLTSSTPLFCRLAVGSAIQDLGNGTFSINDRSYLIQVPKGVTAKITGSGAQQVLYVPVSETITYSLIW